MRIEKINVDKIKPNTWNPNQMTEEQERYLEQEYKRIGYVQPILVRPKDNYYEIIDGEHRWRIAKKVGLKEIECVVIELSEEEAKLTTINMNKIKGVDNPIKLAELLEELKTDTSLINLVAMEEEEINSLIEVMNEREIEDLSELEEKEKEPKIITCPKCGYEIQL